jgi:hypothetical protein
MSEPWLDAASFEGVTDRPLDEVQGLVNPIVQRVAHEGALYARLMQFLRMLAERRLEQEGVEANAPEGQLPSLTAGGFIDVEHTYREQGQGESGTTVTIEVHYGHMRSAARGIRPGAVVPLDTPLGEGGITGNAFTPHVHMEITVKQGRDVLGWLSPFDFTPGASPAPAQPPASAPPGGSEETPPATPPEGPAATPPASATEQP